MNEEQIKALVTDSVNEAVKTAVTTATTEILTQVDNKNSATAASIQREFKKALEPITTSIEGLQKPPETPQDKDEPAKGGKLTLKALQQQLDAVTSDLGKERSLRESQEKAALSAEKTSVLDRAIAGANLINGGLLRDVLQQRWGSKLTKDGNQWFIEEGDSVKAFDAAFGEFLNTEEANAFKSPSQTKGSGSTEGKPGGNPSGKVDLDQAFMEAF